ncbi:MAG: hypothetical protein K2Z81_23660, partial [Cyanobacteria bacterium]|nr:hypothetical protein [Cyanobacteriota bacterium]
MLKFLSGRRRLRELATWLKQSKALLDKWSYEEAWHEAHKALEVAQKIGDGRRLAECYSLLAEVCRRWSVFRTDRDHSRKLSFESVGYLLLAIHHLEPCVSPDDAELQRLLSAAAVLQSKLEQHAEALAHWQRIADYREKNDEPEGFINALWRVGQ